MKKTLLFIAVLSAASLSFAGGDHCKDKAKCEAACCKDAKVECKDCKDCAAKADCKDAKECQKECDKPAAKEQKK